MKSISIGLLFVLLVITPVSAREIINAEEYFPLKVGNYWIYQGDTRSDKFFDRLFSNRHVARTVTQKVDIGKDAWFHVVTEPKQIWLRTGPGGVFQLDSHNEIISAKDTIDDIDLLNKLREYYWVAMPLTTGTTGPVYGMGSEYHFAYDKLVRVPAGEFNCMEVTLLMSPFFSGDEDHKFELVLYFAKGVGLIRTLNKIDDRVTYSEDLLEYHLD